MLLYGKNSVFERLKANPKSIRKIFLQDDFSAPHIESLMKARNIPVSRVSEKEIYKIKRADNLQGIIAEINQFSYVPFDEIISKTSQKRLSLICLDSISDPQNLGAIIRTLACFGGFAAVIPRHDSCEVNETVLHVASGGDNYVPVSMVTNLSSALRQAKEAGYWISGSLVDGGEDIRKVSLPFPLCLVLGSEGKGLRPGIEKQLELKLNLPMKGAALSFNVSIACAIFCYEIDKQQHK